MTAAAVDFRARLDSEGDPDQIAERLLRSSQSLSYDPDTDIEWEAPLDPILYGLNPEWSTLYGTDLWDEMTQEQRVTLTRHEVGSIMQIGIWFEMILQQMIIRDQYVKDPTTPEFQFALTEIADECRHSIMFAKAATTMDVPFYKPPRLTIELARGLKAVAGGELAYGCILVAEEILDVMQRDWMRGENVLPMIRMGSKIHVVEESRHMKFARHEIRGHLKAAGRPRRHAAALVIAIAACFVVHSLVRPGVYAAVGLDVRRAKRAARHNRHHQNLMRLSCVHLMDFLSSAGLLTPAAARFYRRAHML